jgi:hypothetical protein
LADLIGIIDDASGSLHVSVWQKDSGSPLHKNKVEVEPEEGWVVIGGGGVGSPSPGGFLTASFPNTELTKWNVHTTDHTDPDEHSVIAYALGLKVDGIDYSTLHSMVNVVSVRSTRVSHPDASATLNPEFLLIGGGFRIDPEIDANLGVGSFPQFDRTWRSRSKDHITPRAAVIESFAIGIQSRPRRARGRFKAATAYDQTRLSSQPEAQAKLPDGFALSGVGAVLNNGEPGLLLWKLAPFLEDLAGNQVQGVVAGGHDHIDADKAVLQAWAIGIQYNLDACE